jgi:hypothetical protein
MFVCLMMFNTTFNNISVISWRSVFLVEERSTKYLLWYYRFEYFKGIQWEKTAFKTDMNLHICDTLIHVTFLLLFSIYCLKQQYIITIFKQIKSQNCHNWGKGLFCQIMSVFIRSLCIAEIGVLFFFTS